jgi:hypothetical protein
MNSPSKNLDEFFVIRNSHKVGPYTKEMILDNLRAGILSVNDLAAAPQSDNWQPLQHYFSRHELESSLGSIKLNELEDKFTDLNERKADLVDPEKTSVERVQRLPPANFMGLHSSVVTLAIIVDIMIFIMSIPTAGVVILAAIFLAIITFLIQKSEGGDSSVAAFYKAATVMLLTGIPVPICTALIVGHRLFGGILRT